MKQLDTDFEVDEARMLADAIKAADVIDWFADDADDARMLKAMIFGGRL